MACGSLNFLLVVPCSLTGEHAGPHVGVVSDGRKRCRAAWLADYGRSWRMGRPTDVDNSVPPAVRDCRCACHSTWSAGSRCLCCALPAGWIEPRRTV